MAEALFITRLLLITPLRFFTLHRTRNDKRRACDIKQDMIFSGRDLKCFRTISSASSAALSRLRTPLRRLCAAKLLRFSEIVEFAIGNTRQVVKRTLEEMRKQKTSHEFTEEWWKTTESTRKLCYIRRCLLQSRKVK